MDPFVAIAPRFCSIRYPHFAKFRLASLRAFSEMTRWGFVGVKILLFFDFELKQNKQTRHIATQTLYMSSLRRLASSTELLKKQEFLKNKTLTCHPERSKRHGVTFAQSNFCGSSEASKQKRKAIRRSGIHERILLSLCKKCNISSTKSHRTTAQRTLSRQPCSTL